MKLGRYVAQSAGHRAGVAVGSAIARGWLAFRRFHWRRIHPIAVWVAFACFFGYLSAGALGYNLKGTWFEIAAGAGMAYGFICGKMKDPDRPKPVYTTCECCGQSIRTMPAVASADAH